MYITKWGWVLPIMLTLMLIDGCSEQTGAPTLPLPSPTNLQFEIVRSGTYDHLNSVSFCTKNIGIAVGNEGTLLRTADGGRNWVQQTRLTSADLRKVVFATESVGYIVGQWSTVLRTKDAGLTWQQLIPEQNSFRFFLNDISFWADDGGVITETHYIFNSARGGTFRVGRDTIDWSHVETQNGIYSIRAINDSQMVAVCNCIDLGPCGSTVSLVNYNSGSIAVLDSADSFELIAVDGNDAGWLVVGAHGLIRGNDKLQVGWDSIPSGTHVNLNDVHVTKNGVGFVVGQSGVLLFSFDILKTWAIQKTPTEDALNSVFGHSDYSGVAVGENGTIIRFERQD